MAAAVIPIPVADIGAISAVELDMMRSLGNIYGLAWHEGIGKKALGIGGAAMTGQAIWSAVKLIPGLGTVVGGIGQMIVAGTVCYALGKAYQAYLESGGGEFDHDSFSADLDSFKDEGRRVANELKDDVRAGKFDR